MSAWCRACRPFYDHDGRPRRTDIVRRTCDLIGCGVEYWAPTEPLSNPRWRDRYCSRRHSVMAVRRARQAANAAEDDLGYRRSMPRDVRLAIAYRDGYRCHLCRRLIDLSRPAHHPAALAIDHLIPVSAGGTDDPANLAAAHARCNRRRSDTGPAQLQMFG